METFTRTYFPSALPNRPKQATIHPSESMVVIDWASGLPTTLPLYTVTVDGQEHVTGVQLATARFIAQCVTGNLAA